MQLLVGSKNTLNFQHFEVGTFPVCRIQIISIMRLNIEESGALAKGNQHHAFFLRGNSLGLRLCDYSIWQVTQAFKTQTYYIYRYTAYFFLQTTWLYQFIQYSQASQLSLKFFCTVMSSYVFNINSFFLACFSSLQSVLGVVSQARSESSEK